jgi:hypothetical protein
VSLYIVPHQRLGLGFLPPHPQLPLLLPEPSPPSGDSSLRACSVIFNPYGLKGLIRIERDFDLLGIETLQSPSIHMDWGRTEQALKGRHLHLACRGPHVRRLPHDQPSPLAGPAHFTSCRQAAPRPAAPGRAEARRPTPRPAAPAASPPRRRATSSPWRRSRRSSTGPSPTPRRLGPAQRRPRPPPRHLRSTGASSVAALAWAHGLRPGVAQRGCV